MAEERWPGHRQERRVVFFKHMGYTELIMPMGLLKKAQIPLEAIFAFPLLDFIFHTGDVGGQLEGLAIAEPEIVVGLAFHQLHAFGFERGVQVVEGFPKEMGE